MNTIVRPALLLAFGISIAVGPAQAQAGRENGQGVFSEALDRYEARMQGIRAYTVIQDFMGFRSTVRWVPEMVSGRRVFSPRRSLTAVAPGSVGGEGVDHLGTSTWDDPFRYFLDWGTSAVLEGEAHLDGRRLWRVRVDDFAGANFGLTPGTFAEGHFEPRIGWFLFDADDFLLYRVEAEGALLYGGQSREVTVTADLADYRTVRGMIHPFAIELAIGGLGTSATRAEQDAARQQLVELQAQLDALPEGERSTLQALLNDQIDRLRGITEGRLALTLRVTDLDVETGGSPP